MSDVVKENPCIKCTNYERNRKCYCYDFEKYYPYQQGRADAIAELKPFFDSLAENPFDWICDDMCGEYESCLIDETWCAEHCKDGMDYECVKKWCELKEQKNE